MIKGFPSISIIYATDGSPAKPNDLGRRAIQECPYDKRKRCLRPTRDQLDVVKLQGKRCLRPMGDQVDLLKFQGRSSSLLEFGWPAAIASRVALR